MSFRKIDVDAYDEDVLQETELYDPDPREPAQVLSDAKQKQLAVRSALNKLRLSLFHPPFLRSVSVSVACWGVIMFVELTRSLARCAWSFVGVTSRAL